MGEPDEKRFPASKETLARWGASQRVLAGFATLAGLSLVLWIATGSLRGSGFIGLVALAVLVYAWVVGYYLYRRSSRTRPEGVTWVGGSSLRVAAVRSAGLTDELLVTRERQLRFWTRGVGAVMGRLELRHEGLRWTFGWSARVLGVRGRVRIPWQAIESIEVGDVPGTIRQLGGGIAVHLKNRRHLDAQFLGSREDLRDALAGSPLRKKD